MMCPGDALFKLFWQFTVKLLYLTGKRCAGCKACLKGAIISPTTSIEAIGAERLSAPY